MKADEFENPIKHLKVVQQSVKTGNSIPAVYGGKDL